MFWVGKVQCTEHCLPCISVINNCHETVFMSFGGTLKLMQNRIIEQIWITIQNNGPWKDHGILFIRFNVHGLSYYMVKICVCSL